MPEPYESLFDHHPRYNTAGETAEIAAALDAVDVGGVLGQHLRALAAAHVYADPTRDSATWGAGYLRERFGTMRGFYAEAARRGQAVFVDLG